MFGPSSPGASSPAPPSVAADAALVDAVAAADDLGSWGAGALAEAMAAWCRQQSRLEAVGARLTAAWDAAGGWGADGAVSARQWLGSQGGLGDGSARVRTARILRDRARRTAAAWEAGRLSAAQARLIVGVARDEVAVEFEACEELLIDTVAGLTITQAKGWLQRWLAMAQDAAGVDRDTRDREARQARVWEGFQGLVALEATFDPVVGAAVKAALDAHEQRLYRTDVAAARTAAGLDAQEAGEEPAVEGLPLARTAAQRRADALAELITAGAEHLGHDHGGLGGPSTQLVVTATTDALAAAVDHDPLAAETCGSGDASCRCGDATTPDRASGGRGRAVDPALLGGRAVDPALLDPDGRGAVTVDGLATPLAPAAVALLACDSIITAAVVDGRGVPLTLGRSHRLATAAQRRALTLRDGPGCAHPHCDQPTHWCDAHHIHPWETGGPTDLDNLVLVCRRHHRHLHTHDPDRRWHVAIHPTTRRPHWWRHHHPPPTWHRPPERAPAPERAPTPGTTR